MSFNVASNTWLRQKLVICVYIVQPVLDEKFLVCAMYCLGCKCGVYGMYFGIYIGMYFGMYIGQLTTRATNDVYCLWSVWCDCCCRQLQIGRTAQSSSGGDNLCNLSYETPSSDNTTGQKKRWAWPKSSNQSKGKRTSPLLIFLISYPKERLF